MTTGKLIRNWHLAALATIAAACSSSSGTTLLSVQGVVQDLNYDPDGLTTVLSLEDTPAFATVANVKADGGQSAQSVFMIGSTVYVVWDARVTPSHKVRVVGVPNVNTAWRGVQSSDPSAPTFTITGANQDTGDALLGGDTIEVTFSGPRVVESMVENSTNWDLEVNGQSMDLTGSTFVLTPATQVVDITLGASANLHSSFELTAINVASVADTAVAATAVAGTATGDAVAPTLLSIEQDLGLDAYGRVVDFSFDEPMDPIFAAIPGSFSLVDHADAIGATLITAVDQPDASTLRLTFSRPVAPGLDTISHAGLMDAHGNAFGAATEVIANPAPVANAFDTVTPTTVESGADTVTIVTTQALDPDFAADPTRWSMTIDGGGVTMADQALAYDLLTRTLIITLDSDMRNGDAVVVDSVGQVDVDGQTFTVTAGSENASGDASAPTFVSAVQNRTVDPAGYTVDVTFSEAVHLTEGQDLSNYTFAPGGTVTAATVVGAGNVVRVVTSDLIMTPGDVTVTIDADVDDLAGNPLGSVSGPNAMTSTDATAPEASVLAGSATEGADNDTLVVTFDDSMIESEVENLTYWTVESPVGTNLDVSAASVDYDSLSRSATVTLDAGDQALKFYDDVQVSFVTMRDIGGNTVESAALAGTISAERRLPSLHTVWRYDAPRDGTLELRFSEPSDNLEDLFDAGSNPYGTKYALRDSGGTLRGYPSSATAQDDGLGVRLQYGFTIALTDTLDVLSVEDLAGNVMFPAMDAAIEAQDSDAPAHSGAPTITAIAGENNDTIFITFSEDMSPWQVTNPDSYTIETNPGGQAVTFGESDIDWDGASTVTITLSGPYGDNLQSADNYDVTLNLIASEPMGSDQGVALASSDTQTVAVAGDNSNGPLQGSSSALVDTDDANSLIVVFNEAVDETSIETPADFDYDGGNIATAVTLLSPRVVRATFGVAVSPGFNLVIAQASAVDLAGNDAGADMTIAVSADSIAPLLASVAGTVGEGAGGDLVVVSFNEQLDTVSALDVSNYTVNNGGAVDLTGVALYWDSVTETVTLALPPGTELDVTQAISVTVEDVSDPAGNVMPAPVTLAGTVSGDATAPAIASAWTNRRLESLGTMIDVLFDEQVDESFAGDALNWDTDGSPVVTDVEVMGPNHVRLTLTSALAAGDEVVLTAGLEDLARNAAGSLTAEPIDPTE